MLTVLSPAKTLDYETPVTIKTHTQPQFAKRSAELINVLLDYTPKRLGKLMSISDKLAQLNVDRYEAWQPKASKKNARQALLAFKGDVYQGVDAYSLSEADFEFAQEHLRLLSGLYGALRPLDLIQPYRLEMGTKLKTDHGKDLYDFWGDDITLALNKQLKKTKSQTLLNLASNEYFDSVRPDLLKANVISPVFKDLKNGKYKLISFFAKKARGTMAGWVIRKRIIDPKKLVKFAEDGYRYDADSSTPDKPVFLRG
jgi:cytoplasmic iron level regulating protein YaaA (DUF328/UPF0246 family)